MYLHCGTKCLARNQFKMDYNLKRFTFFLNVIFLIFFLVHVFSIGYALKYPEHPSNIVYMKKLDEMEFPISFKLCIRELKNVETRYRNMGYNHNGDFFKGISKVRKKGFKFKYCITIFWL